MDRYDKKILFQLDKNSRVTLNQLSKITRKSKQFVTYRIKRLEEEGIIKGYRAIIDASKLGFTTHRIYVKFQNSDQATINQFIEYVKPKEEVLGLALMNGKWDFALFLGTKNTLELHQFWDELFLTFKHHLRSYNFCLYQPIHFFTRRFFIEEAREPGEIVYGEGSRAEYDETDLKIIKEIENNSRKAATEVATQLGLSTDTVIRRIKNLQNKKIICGYNLHLDYEKLGVTEYRVDLYLNSTQRNKELFQFCKQHAHIFCVNMTIGGADFEIALAARSFYEFTNILGQIKSKFKDVINSDEYIGFSSFSLVRYIPD